MADPQHARLLLLLTRHGAKISDAISHCAGPEVSRNTSVIVLVSLGLDGPRHPSTFQHLTDLSSGGVTHLLESLEQAGYTASVRPRDRRDRRAVDVHLTDRGQAAFQGIVSALEATQPDLQALVRNLAEHLD